MVKTLRPSSDVAGRCLPGKPIFHSHFSRKHWQDIWLVYGNLFRVVHRSIESHFATMFTNTSRRTLHKRSEINQSQSVTCNWKHKYQGVPRKKKPPQFTASAHAATHTISNTLLSQRWRKFSMKIGKFFRHEPTQYFLSSYH